jgi:hypothetical protein
MNAAQPALALQARPTLPVLLRIVEALFCLAFLCTTLLRTSKGLETKNPEERVHLQDSRVFSGSTFCESTTN